METFEEWVECAEDIAYGVLNLKPREFDNLQPGEFYKLIKGYESRIEQEDWHRAYFVANLMNAQGCKPAVQPKKLIEGLYGRKYQVTSEEDKRALEEQFPGVFRKDGE